MQVGDKVRVIGTSPRSWNKTWCDKLTMSEGTIMDIKQLTREKKCFFLVQMDDPEKRAWWFIEEELHFLNKDKNENS